MRRVIFVGILLVGVFFLGKKYFLRSVSAPSNTSEPHATILHTSLAVDAPHPGAVFALPLKVSGHATPRSLILMSLEGGSGVLYADSTMSDADGSFEFVIAKLGGTLPPRLNLFVSIVGPHEEGVATKVAIPLIYQ